MHDLAFDEPPAGAPGLVPWVLYLLSARDVGRTGSPGSGQSVAPSRRSRSTVPVCPAKTSPPRLRLGAAASCSGV